VLEKLVTNSGGSRPKRRDPTKSGGSTIAKLVRRTEPTDILEFQPREIAVFLTKTEVAVPRTFSLYVDMLINLLFFEQQAELLKAINPKEYSRQAWMKDDKHVSGS